MRLSESRSSPPYAALLQTAYGALSTQILCVAALLCGDIRSFADETVVKDKEDRGFTPPRPAVPAGGPGQTNIPASPQSGVFRSGMPGQPVSIVKVNVTQG